MQATVFLNCFPQASIPWPPSPGELRFILQDSPVASLGHLPEGYHLIRCSHGSLFLPSICHISKSEFLILSTIDTLGWICLCYGRCPVQCRMFCSISGLCPLDARSTFLPGMTTRNVSRHRKCPLEATPIPSPH